jgi:iron complex transport system ATP-binding protein
MRYCENLILLNNGIKTSEGIAKDVLTIENMQAVYGVDAIFGEHQGSHWVLPWQDKKREKV